MSWISLKPVAKDLLGRLVSKFITPDMAYVSDTPVITGEVPVFDLDGQVIELELAKNILKVFFDKYQGLSPAEIAQELSGLTCDEDSMWTTNQILWKKGLYLMRFDNVCKANIFETEEEFNNVCIIIAKVYGNFVPICVLEPKETV